MPRKTVTELVVSLGHPAPKNQSEACEWLFQDGENITISLWEKDFDSDGRYRVNLYETAKKQKESGHPHRYRKSTDMRLVLESDFESGRGRHYNVIVCTGDNWRPKNRYIHESKYYVESCEKYGEIVLAPVK